MYYMYMYVHLKVIKQYIGSGLASIMTDESDMHV